MSAQTAIRTYDNYVIGNGRFFLSSPFDMEAIDKNFDPQDEIEKRMMFEKRVKNRKRAEAAKEKDALAIVRYVITIILSWTPEDAMEYMTPALMKQLHLDVLKKYISVPPNVAKDDCRWISRSKPYMMKRKNFLRSMTECCQEICRGSPRVCLTGKTGITVSEFSLRHI